MCRTRQGKRSCGRIVATGLFFRTIFVFVVIELESRQLVHFGMTRSPDDSWVAHQLREATPFGEAPHFLIRDNGAKFGDAFDRVPGGSGIEVLTRSNQALKANAICECFLGSVRRECLDFFLILSEQHLRRIMKQYQACFYHARPHQGLDQHIPCPPEPLEKQAIRGEIVSQPVLGGLHHDISGVHWPDPHSRTLPECWREAFVSATGVVQRNNRIQRAYSFQGLGRLEANSWADVDWHFDERVCELLSDRPFCCLCADTTVLKWTKLVIDSLFEGSPERIVLS
jgi:hypothetical protein